MDELQLPRGVGPARRSRSPGHRGTACGLDSAASSTPYVAGWSGGDPKIIGAAAETVRREAAAILGDLYAAEIKEDQAAESPAEEPAAAAT